ncbi:unnamed protein product, partial [Sphagnum troendelagicum]
MDADGRFGQSYVGMISATNRSAFEWSVEKHGRALLTYNHLNMGGAPYGPYWRHLRKICTMELFTSKRLQSFRPPRTDEFNQMITSIMDDVEQGKIVNLAMKLSHAAMYNMTRMLLNKRFYGVDASAQQEAYKFKELTYNLFKLAATRSIGDFVPWLKWVIVVSGLKSRMMKVKAKADVVLQEFLEVKKNGKSINVKNDDVHCEDFIDVLMAQAAVDGTGNLSDNSIKAVTHDMLLAGTDTSASTIEWAIAELLHSPHCAKKLQAELDEVVGKDRIVTESDIPNLPYLSAVVKEVLRLRLMFVVFFVMQRKKLRLPQGPRSLPIIGNIHQLANDAHTFLWQEAKKYGPIMYLRLGSEGLVVASSAEVAREFLKVQDKVWAGRESTTGMDMLTYNHLDIVGAPYGPYWLHLRKICTMELFTTKRLESFRPPRTDEFNQMIKSIMDDVEQGKIVNLAVKLGHVAVNNITRMLLNKRFYGLDASAQHQAYKFKQLNFDLPNLATTWSIGDFVPWLKWVIIVSGLKSRMMKVKARADVLLQEFLEAKKSGKIINVKNDDVHCEDFVDVLMAQPAQDGTGHLSDNSIKAVILDMLLAGTDTSANTVEWAIAELLRHPHCAKKLQAELDEVVGKDRIVTESDIPDLPYLNAVLKEVLRLHPPVPINITHVALEDTTVGGFDFVAGTRLSVNIYAIQRDPKWWERPLEFDPERFMKNPEINPLGSHFQFIPFGSGRRKCPGLMLGLLFVQIGLARLMQSFDFALPHGQDPTTVDMTEKFGFSLPRRIPLQV